MNLANDIGIPTKIAGSITEAAPILHKLLGADMAPEIDAAALTRASDELRARLSA